MFGGHGSLKNVLKNNKDLLHKKRFFKSKKSFSDKKLELLKGAEGELEFVKVTDKKLLDIKNRIKEKANQRNKKYLIVSLLIIVALILFIWCFLEKETKREQELEKLMDERGNIIGNQKRLELYNMYLEEAEVQAKNFHWKNATYFYNKALKSFPDDSLVISKLKEIEEVQFIQIKQQ